MKKIEDGIDQLGKLIQALGDTIKDPDIRDIIVQASIANKDITNGINEAIFNHPEIAHVLLMGLESQMIQLFNEVFSLAMRFSNNPASEVLNVPNEPDFVRRELAVMLAENIYTIIELLSTINKASALN